MVGAELGSAAVIAAWLHSPTVAAVVGAAAVLAGGSMILASHRGVTAAPACAVPSTARPPVDSPVAADTPRRAG